MSKKTKTLFILEVLFLGIVFGLDASYYGIQVGKISFNIAFGEGIPEPYISTVIIGYILAILFNLSLKDKAKKSSYILCVLGIISYLFEFSRLFVYMPFCFLLRPDLVILIIDGINFFRLKKDKH